MQVTYRYIDKNVHTVIYESVDLLIVITIRILTFKCSVLITITIRRSTLSYFAKCGCSYRYDDKYLVLEIPFIFKFTSYLSL